MDGDNLRLVLGAWLDAHRSGTADAIAAILDEDAQWEGPVRGALCANRREIVTLIGRQAAYAPRLTRLEAFEAGDHVVICAEGPDLHPGGDAGPEGLAYLVFTVRDGRVVHMRGVASREAALEAAGTRS